MQLLRNLLAWLLLRNNDKDNAINGDAEELQDPQ